MAVCTPLQTLQQFKESNQEIKGFEAGESYEEKFSLVKNTRSRKRSFSHSAFPEHHNKSKVVGDEEPEYILMLTRSKIDSHGRRYKVCIPLIPPPTGERFEGGHHIEKNHITGGYRLEGPAPVKTKSGWSSVFSSKSKKIPIKKKCVKRAASAPPTPAQTGQIETKALLGASKCNTQKPRSPNSDIVKIAKDLEQIELDKKDQNSNNNGETFDQCQKRLQNKKKK